MTVTWSGQRDRRSSTRQFVRETAYPAGLGVFICMTGIWAATIVIPVTAVCLTGRRVTSDQQDLEAGDDDDRVARTRETAHLRLGHRRVSVIPAARMTAVVAGAWLVAVGMGALPFTYRLPLSGFAPDWSAIPSAVFGLALLLAVTAPAMLLRSRRRERAADDLALHLLGDGPGYARWIEEMARRNHEPMWPPRLFAVLAWSYPSTGDRIERALAYGSRPAMPSLTPAGVKRRGWFEQHHQAAMMGAWAWILVVGWVLGKLHSGGMIH